MIKIEAYSPKPNQVVRYKNSQLIRRDSQVNFNKYLVKVFCKEIQTQQTGFCRSNAYVESNLNHFCIENRSRRLHYSRFLISSKLLNSFY